MPLDPENKPREFLTVLVAAGLLIVRQNVLGAADAYKAAEEFVAGTERRIGKLNP